MRALRAKPGWRGGSCSQPGLAIGIAYLTALWARGHFLALGIGALRCSGESGDSGARTQLRQAVFLR